MNAPIDRLHLFFDRLVNAAMRRVDFFAKYSVRVVRQADDLSIEFKPDSSTIPGDVKVPIRLGIPGVKVKVAPGARCGIEFENGDPEKPIATTWEPNAEDLIEIAFADGTQKVARVDDDIDCGYLVGIAPSGGGPVTWTLSPVSVPNSIHLVGKITTGADKVKA